MAILTLTHRQIVQLHNMHANGASHQDICRTLDLSRNSVTAHLSGDVTYPEQVYSKIKLRAKLDPSATWLTMREAASWMPGHPSPSKMARLSVRICDTPHLQTQIIKGSKVTKLKWIKQLKSLTYPQGIWVCEATIAASDKAMLKQPQLVPYTDHLLKHCHQVDFSELHVCKPALDEGRLRCK